MLWLVKGKESLEIISCNVYYTNDAEKVWQVWVEKPTGKTRNVFEGTEVEAWEVKKAIDYAISSGETTFELE